MTSCAPAFYASYPHKDEVTPGERLPIDGTWVNEKNGRFRVKHGMMFVDDPSILPPLKNGFVIGKNIKKISSRKYTLEAGSHNASLRVAGFGRGEIEVDSDSTLLFRTYPNERTRLWKQSVDKFHVSELHDPAWFVAQLGISDSPLHEPVSSIASQSESGMPLSEQAIGERWAVVIGISSYRDTRVPSLRYASADARAFYRWAVSAHGGRIAPSRVRLLMNEAATGVAIRDALFNWLDQALAEDVVTIYFAGHGSAQSPDHPNNLFLLPYDVDFTNVATTAFPMWDIKTALKRFIKARKVVVITDACHAGGIGQSFDVARRANRAIEVNPISSGLQDLAKVGDGVCVINASDAKQFSREGQEWGGGHGVFTYFLLKALKGEADYSKDGRVTLGELIPYLSEQVRRATRSAQCPTVAGKFDPALTIGK